MEVLRSTVTLITVARNLYFTSPGSTSRITRSPAAGGYGIDVSGIKDGLLARNTLKDCTDIYDGLAFETLDNFVIRDNTITNSSGDAYMNRTGHL